MKVNVFIAVRGEDCEGYEILDVFSTKEAAEEHLEKIYPKWKKDKYGDRRSGCSYASIEEFEVDI